MGFVMKALLLGGPLDLTLIDVPNYYFGMFGTVDLPIYKKGTIYPEDIENKVSLTHYDIAVYQKMSPPYVGKEPLTLPYELLAYIRTYTV